LTATVITALADHITQEQLKGCKDDMEFPGFPWCHQTYKTKPIGWHPLLNSLMLLLLLVQSSSLSATVHLDDAVAARHAPVEQVQALLLVELSDLAQARLLCMPHKKCIKRPSVEIMWVDVSSVA
jgi:hypothetical protein